MDGKPPSSLYKYRVISDKGYTRKIITDGERYFPSYNELNDPNEMMFCYEGTTEMNVSTEEKEEYPDAEIIAKLLHGRLRIKVDGASESGDYIISPVFFPIQM